MDLGLCHVHAAKSLALQLEPGRPGSGTMPAQKRKAGVLVTYKGNKGEPKEANSARRGHPSATDATRELILDADYWRRLVPFLRVGEMDEKALALKAKGPGCTPLGMEQLRQQRQKILEDGYCVVDRCEQGEHQNLDQLLVDKLAFAASILEFYGWPTTFLAMYDEAWQLAQQCQHWMDRLTEAHAPSSHGVRNEFCMDIVGFNVVDGIGFSAHRDRQPEDWQPKGHASDDPKTTFDNGFARYITCWVALSDAHPSNSCLHYLTAKADPGYYGGDSVDGDPMARCFAGNKAAFQNIRACPVKKGGFIAHTHRVIHWGNQGEGDDARMQLDWLKHPAAASSGSPADKSKSVRMHHVSQLIQSGALPALADEAQLLRSLRALPANPCRCAISFSFANNAGASFEPPYLPSEHLPLPRFELRSSVCAAQILNYSTLAFGDPRGWMTLAGRSLKRKHLSKLYKVFEGNAQHFAQHYREEIARKFVAVTLQKGGDLNVDCTGVGLRGTRWDSGAREEVGEVGDGGYSKTDIGGREVGDWGYSKTDRSLKGAKDHLRGDKGKGTNGSGGGVKKTAEGEEEEEGAGGEEDLDENELDATLDAMLEAESSNQSVLFHDDFDMLAASGVFGKRDSLLAGMGRLGGREGGKKKSKGGGGGGKGGEERRSKVEERVRGKEKKGKKDGVGVGGGRRV